MEENGCFIRFTCRFDKSCQHNCNFYQKGNKITYKFRGIFYLCYFFDFGFCNCKEAQKEYLKNLLE